MKPILAIATLMAALSLCNLSDKLKPEAKPSPDKPTTAATDRGAVLAELLTIEKIMTDASLNGDIATLAPYIADDYSGAGIDGRSQSKNQLLASTKLEKNIKSWTITEAQLVSLDNESAVLNYLQTVNGRNGRSARARVIDTFVRHDGSWQIKSEQQTLIR
jgi:hypothetical protein